MLKPLTRLAFIFLLISIACSMPTAAQTPSATPRAVSQLLVTAGPDSTATPTPFQPIGPTSTPEATATPLPTETPEPEKAAEEPTPIIVAQDLPEGNLSILLMGSDFRPSSGFRTDVIMLVTINAKKGKVSVVSFPRDLYITIPGWTTQRINTAFPHGGFSMMADTMETNFGVRPKYYILTNLQGFVGIINSMGGITVNVGQYLSDKCDHWKSVKGYCTVNPGPVVMDGDFALWYVRSRYTSSDFDRLRRAQEVIYGIFANLMSRNVILRLPELYNNYKSSVETNIGIDDIIPFLPVASQIISNPSRVYRYSIGPGQVYPYWTADGAAVLLPNYGAINQIMQEALTFP